MELICAVDELSMKIRKALGESDRYPSDAGGILPATATAQAEALTLFVRALALEGKGNYEGALGMLQQTVVLNPRFALAQLKLGELLMRLGAAEAAIDHIARAVEESDSLPAKEKLRALAIHAVLKLDYGVAGKLCGDLESLYPNDSDAQAQLADLALRVRQFGLAIQHYEKAIRLEESKVEFHLGLCMAHLFARDTEGAHKAMSGAQSLDPENPSVICTNGFIDLVDNNLGAALRSFRRVSESSSPYTKSLGLSLTAQAHLYGGHFRAALETLQEGIDLDRSRRAQASEAKKRICRALIHLMLGDESSALEECRQVPPMKFRPDDLGRIGLVYAQSGLASEARQVLEQMDKLPNTPPNRYHASILAGEIEMSSGHPQDAIPIFARARNLLPGGGPCEPLARALFQAQRYDEAEREYRLVCEQKAEMLFPRTETWFMGTWPHALYETAQCLTALHKDDEAAQYLRSYLWVLDGSDPGNPKVRQAQASLKKGGTRFATP
jgi:tetratricopeptide (TPR) repeat protein